jgi:transcriptional regulator with GAF, ATPase, and Fis domain
VFRQCRFCPVRRADQKNSKIQGNKEIMKSNGRAITLVKTEPMQKNGGQSSAAMENRLEALRVLSTSILREVEALKKARNNILPQKINLAEEVQRYEMDLIRCALLRTGGRQRQAARLLNVKVTTLNAKIKRYGISINSVSQENEMEIPA